MGTSLNRFDALRLAFASVVFIYHAVVLSGRVPGSALELTLAQLAEAAIQGFFIISGTLVFGSWQRSRNLADYAGKRIRRLYPAYVVIIFIPAMLSASLMFADPGAWRQIGQYLSANLLFLNFLEPTLAGLFEANRLPAVNGALWTLKIEVMFYIAVPILAWALNKLGRYWWLGLGLIVLSSLLWRDVMLALDHPLREQFARQLPGQMMFFAAGMAMWKLWEIVRRYARVLLLVGIAALIASSLVPELETLRVLGLFGIIAGVAFAPGPPINAARWGDVSYGVYIVHFPIVQGLVAFGVFNLVGLWLGVLISALIVFPISYLLWWWVEKPALRHDSHYRKISEERAEEWPSMTPSNWTPPETASRS